MSKIKEIPLTSWEAFEEELDLNGEMSARYPSLFRGQRRATPCSETSKANWAVTGRFKRDHPGSKWVPFGGSKSPTWGFSSIV